MISYFWEASPPRMPVRHSELIRPTDCDKVALIMEPEGFLAHIENLFRNIATLFSILLAAPKVLKLVRKAWKVARPWLLDTKRALVATLREMVGEDEAREESPMPPQNTTIVPLTDTLGITGQAPHITVQLTGGIIHASGSRLIGSLS